MHAQLTEDLPEILNMLLTLDDKQKALVMQIYGNTDSRFLVLDLADPECRLLADIQNTRILLQTYLVKSGLV